MKIIPRFHALRDGWILVHPSSADAGRQSRWRPPAPINRGITCKRRNLYDEYENIAMAKDRAAGSRHLDQYGLRGLGPGTLSDTFRWIDLGVYGHTLQKGRLSGMAGAR